MKKSLLIIFIIGIVLGILLSFVKIQKTSVSNIFLHPTPTVHRVDPTWEMPTLIPTPQAEDMIIFPSQTIKGWKTYLNPTNHFMISYPSDWKIEPEFFKGEKGGSIRIKNSEVVWDLVIYTKTQLETNTYLGARQWPDVAACGAKTDICNLRSDNKVFNVFGYPVSKQYIEYRTATNQVFNVEFLLDGEHRGDLGFGWIYDIPTRYPQLSSEVDKENFYSLSYEMTQNVRQLTDINQLKGDIRPYMDILDQITRSIVAF